MKKIGQIIIIIFAVLVLIVVAYISSKITGRYYKAIDIAEQKQSIINANTKELEAKIENDNWQAIVDSLELALIKKHELSYAPPPETDEDIPQVDEYIPFVPDIVPDLPEIIEDIIEEDTRVATTNYKYRDTVNDYGMDLEIRYPYKTQLFGFTPSNVIFEPKKSYPFSLKLKLWLKREKKN